MNQQLQSFIWFPREAMGNQTISYCASCEDNLDEATTAWCNEKLPMHTCSKNKGIDMFNERTRKCKNTFNVKKHPRSSTIRKGKINR